MQNRGQMRRERDRKRTLASDTLVGEQVRVPRYDPRYAGKLATVIDISVPQPAGREVLLSVKGQKGVAFTSAWLSDIKVRSETVPENDYDRAVRGMINPTQKEVPQGRMDNRSVPTQLKAAHPMAPRDRKHADLQMAAHVQQQSAAFALVADAARDNYWFWDAALRGCAGKLTPYQQMEAHAARARELKAWRGSSERACQLSAIARKILCPDRVEHDTTRRFSDVVEAPRARQPRMKWNWPRRMNTWGFKL